MLLASACRAQTHAGSPVPAMGSQTFKLQYGTVCFMQTGCKATSEKPQVYPLPGELLRLLPVPENPCLRQVKAACQGGSGFVCEWTGKSFILSVFYSSEMPRLQLSSFLLLLRGVAKGETCA